MQDRDGSSGGSSGSCLRMPVSSRRTWLTLCDRPFVKICGITRSEDIEVCIRNRVDAIGILLVKIGQVERPGSDRISVARAASLTRECNGRLLTFLLVHTLDFASLDSYVREIQPTTLQFCVDVPIETLRSLKDSWPGVHFFHVVRVGAGSDVQVLRAKIRGLLDAKVLDGVILDSTKGGSGIVHDWSLSSELVSCFPLVPFLLAGGISAENAQSAVEMVRCDGLDVMSYVRSLHSGFKDEHKVQALMRAVGRGAGG